MDYFAYPRQAKETRNRLCEADLPWQPISNIYLRKEISDFRKKA